MPTASNVYSTNGCGLFDPDGVADVLGFVFYKRVIPSG